MHNNNSEKIQYKELLKNKLEQKFGKKVEYSKDCKLLAMQVYRETGRQLSMSTIKRFFGLTHSPFNPSNYTLDTFSSFLGAENWQGFIESNKSEAAGNSNVNNAHVLKESFEVITKISFTSLSRKVRYNNDTFIHRTFAEEFFEDFMQSGKTGTMLIAPTGYGKSSLLLQWMRTYFSGKDERFRNDVVCLIDGGIFFSFYNLAQENELLTQLLDVDFKTIQKLYENQKSNPEKIRYFLLIDDVDYVFSVREKYYQFAENIMRLMMLYNESPWLKVILTCRPDNLDTFTSLVINNPLLDDIFFKINFFQKNQNDVINIPLFTDDEIKQAFGKHKRNLAYYHLGLKYPEILKIINTPRFFSFFMRDESTLHEEFTEIEFINRLLQYFYFSQPFAEEKQQLIKKFLHICSTNRNYNFVTKEKLLEGIECRIAYQELIKAGLFYEFIDSSNQPEVQLNVRFSNNHIFEYLLTRSVIRERGFSLALINLVFKKFRDIIHLQFSLLAWIVKIAFFEDNASFLKQLHHAMERQVNISNNAGKDSLPGALRTIQTAFVECFRTNSRLSEVLLPEFAKTELGQKLYFEEYFDLDNLMNFPEKSLLSFIKNNKTTNGKMIFHFIRFLKGFYLNDSEACSLEYESISQINFDELNSPLSVGYYFSTWFLYASLNNYKQKEDMLKKFLTASENLRLKGMQSLRFNPGFEFIVVYHLNTCNFFEETRFVAEYLQDSKRSFQNQSSGFFQFFKLCYARSLFHTGEQKQALELYRQVNIAGFPFHMKHFMKINVNLVRYDFLEFQNKTAEALTLLQETRLLAKQLGYKFFVQKAEELESELLNANNDLSS